jgi:hypothetical protein
MRKMLGFVVAGLAGVFFTACGSDTPVTPVAQQPVAQGVDLPLPADEPAVRPEQPAPLSAESLKNFDPMLVKNIDVMDPQRGEYIKSLKILKQPRLVILPSDDKPKLAKLPHPGYLPPCKRYD